MLHCCTAALPYAQSSAHALQVGWTTYIPQDSVVMWGTDKHNLTNKFVGVQREFTGDQWRIWCVETCRSSRAVTLALLRCLALEGSGVAKRALVL